MVVISVIVYQPFKFYLKLNRFGNYNIPFF